MPRKNNIILSDDKGLYVRTSTGLYLRPIVLDIYKHFAETAESQAQFNDHFGVNAVFSPKQTKLKVGDLVETHAGQNDYLGQIKNADKTEYWWVFWSLDQKS